MYGVVKEEEEEDGGGGAEMGFCMCEIVAQGGAGEEMRW